MVKVDENVEEANDGVGCWTLDQLALEGARRMLLTALEEEVAAYLERHQGERDAAGRRLVVRNGKTHHARKVWGGDADGDAPARLRPAGRRTRRAPALHEPPLTALHAPLA